MAVDWQTVKEFIEKEVEKGPDPNRPEILYNSLTILYQMLLAYLKLLEYLEPPQNRGMRECPWCHEEFQPLYAHSFACSEKCESLWKRFPPHFDDETTIKKLLKEER